MAGPKLYEIEDGLLFIDDFQTLNSRWIASPIGSYSLSDRPGYIRLKHHASQDTLILTDIPTDKFACEVFADYTPTADGDEGGVLVWNNSSETIEFVERLDSATTENQTSWMVVKNNTDLRFFSNSGSGYAFVDSDVMESNKFGVILKRGSDPAFTNLDVDKIIATKGNKLRVEGLVTSQKVRLEDTLGNTLAEDILSLGSALELTLPKLELSGTLKVFNPDGSLLCSIDGAFYGGDIYGVGSSIEVRIGTTELDRLSQTDLGTMSAGVLQMLMNVNNPSNVSLTNVVVAIEQYSTKFGWQWADLALDNSGTPGTFGDVLNIANLPANSQVNFWVKVTKGSGVYNTNEPLQFTLHLEHG